MMIEFLVMLSSVVIFMIIDVTAQSIVEQGCNNKWCKTHSIGSLKYKNLKLREKGKKREVVLLRGLLLSS